MPYRWTDHDAAPERSGAVSHELVAWPHRSLPRSGFVWFIAATAGLLALLVPAARHVDCELAAQVADGHEGQTWTLPSSSRP